MIFRINTIYLILLRKDFSNMKWDAMFWSAVFIYVAAITIGLYCAPTEAAELPTKPQAVFACQAVQQIDPFMNPIAGYPDFAFLFGVDHSFFFFSPINSTRSAKTSFLFFSSFCINCNARSSKSLSQVGLSSGGAPVAASNLLRVSG